MLSELSVVLVILNAWSSELIFDLASSSEGIIDTFYSFALDLSGLGDLGVLGLLLVFGDLDFFTLRFGDFGLLVLRFDPLGGFGLFVIRLVSFDDFGLLSPRALLLRDFGL